MIGVLDKIFGAGGYLPCRIAYLYNNYYLSLVRGLSLNVTQVKLGTANITRITCQVCQYCKRRNRVLVKCTIIVQ